MLVAQLCLALCDLMDFSMDFSRQEYWSGLPFSSPGDLPNPGIKSRSPALQADCLPSEPTGMPLKRVWENIILEAGKLGRRQREKEKSTVVGTQRTEAQKTLNKNAEPWASLSFFPKMSNLDSISESYDVNIFFLPLSCRSFHVLF